MKKVEIADNVRADQRLLGLVHRASRQLEEEVGRSSGLVSAAWEASSTMIEDGSG